MSPERIAQVETEMARLQRAINAMHAEHTAWTLQNPDSQFYPPAIHTAAIRRASMDLTRALARLRAPL